MRNNTLTPDLRFNQTGLLIALYLVLFLTLSIFSKAHAEQKHSPENANKYYGSQAQSGKTVAASPRPNTNQNTQKGEAWMEAGEYAKSHPAIGIAVYGKAKDATGEQVGQFIQGVFAKQGIKSQYFLSEIERIGVGVSFYLKDVAYGPTSLQKSVDNVRTIIQHFPEAWPDYQRSIADPTGGKN